MQQRLAGPGFADDAQRAGVGMAGGQAVRALAQGGDGGVAGHGGNAAAEVVDERDFHVRRMFIVR